MSLRQGQARETLACAYLVSQGLAILARNVRSRFGEIDIVALDAATVVFVEVRERRNPRFVSAAESISFHKRQKIRITAEYWLAEHQEKRACRFDAILFDVNDTIEWLKAIDV